MPDNTRQSNTVQGQCGMLSTRYADDPNTFVGSDLLLYDKEDEDGDAVAPDLFVVFGVPDKDRDSYDVREEGKVPDFVLEVASKGTYRKDLGSKKDKYQRMGAREYCVFDPKGDMHRPRLQLFRLEGEVYKCVNRRGGLDAPLMVTSETLGLELRFEDEHLRLWDPETQEYLLEHQEEHAGRLASEQRVRDFETELAKFTERRLGEHQHPSPPRSLHPGWIGRNWTARILRPRTALPVPNPYRTGLWSVAEAIGKRAPMRVSLPFPVAIEPRGISALVTTLLR